MKIFVFIHESGLEFVTARLRKAATLGDAREALARQMGRPSHLLRFASDGKPITNLGARISSLGAPTFIWLRPMIFRFNGHEYSRSVDSSATAKELKNIISEAIERHIPPEMLDLLLNGSTLDDDITLADLEYGPMTPPIDVQEKAIFPSAPTLELYRPNEMRVLFTIRQRAQDVQLVLPKTAKVRQARKKVAEHLGVSPQAVTLLMSRKPLRDTFVLGSLNIGSNGLEVDIEE
jgi:hypothetical protein